MMGPRRLLAVVCFLGFVQPLRTASPLLAYDCNIDPKMCANGFLGIRGACGYKQATGLEIFGGKTGVGGCPKWLQKEIDATCRACLQPSCSMHDRPAEQRFFVQGVQTRFTTVDTTEWKTPVKTCGGRSLSCDMSKCTSNWEVTRRFFSPTCLGTPFQVGLRPATHDIFNMSNRQDCQPKWCIPYYSDQSATPVYYEDTQCSIDTVPASGCQLENSATVCYQDTRRRIDTVPASGDFQAPPGAYITTVSYNATPWPAGRTTGICAPQSGDAATYKKFFENNAILRIDMTLHAACFPDEQTANISGTKPSEAAVAAYDAAQVNNTEETRWHKRYDCNKAMTETECNADCSNCSAATDITADINRCDYLGGSTSKVTLRSNHERCTFYSVDEWHETDTCDRGVTPVLKQVVTDAATSRGLGCFPRSCAAEVLADGNKTGRFTTRVCPDNFPSTPGTPAGGTGVYLIRKVFFDPACPTLGSSKVNKLVRPLPTPHENARVTYLKVAERDGGCVRSDNFDGTFIKVDVEKKVKHHFGVGDFKCNENLYDESFADLIDEDGKPVTDKEGIALCPESSDCGQTSNSVTGYTCVSIFTATQINRNTPKTRRWLDARRWMSGASSTSSRSVSASWLLAALAPLVVSLFALR